MKKKQVSVRKHRRKTKLGSSTVVKRHKRKINSKSSLPWVASHEKKEKEIDLAKEFLEKKDIMHRQIHLIRNVLDEAESRMDTELVQDMFQALKKRFKDFQTEPLKKEEITSIDVAFNCFCDGDFYPIYREEDREKLESGEIGEDFIPEIIAYRCGKCGQITYIFNEDEEEIETEKSTSEEA
jgi:hypothetical protein